jgi:hypothetical protein
MSSVQNAIGTLAQQFFGTSSDGGIGGYGTSAGYGGSPYGGYGEPSAYGAPSGFGNAGGFGIGGGQNGACVDGSCGRGGSVALQDGTLSSTGDPHLAVTGTRLNAGGSTSTVNSHFDSMTGHDDLFSTNTFGDGFNVATSVTQPNANGVTTNASATATMNGGADAVSMSLGGGLQVTSGGSAVALSAGQTVTLSGGEAVTENANGSVTIAEQNAAGSTLDTTFTNTGAGIDVTAQAHDVRLRGDLVTGGSAPAAPAAPATPPYRRIGSERDEWDGATRM